MELIHRIEYLRKEHAELLAIAENLARILLDANSADFPVQQQVLTNLRSFNNHRFNGIVEHCHLDDRLVESTYHKYLSDEDRTLLAEEHARLARLLSAFREELRFATADRVASLSKPGETLVQTLRAHVATEEGYLNKIAKITPSNGKQPVKRLTARARVARKKVRARPGKPFKSTQKPVPYTLEPHPEF